MTHTAPRRRWRHWCLASAAAVALAACATLPPAGRPDAAAAPLPLTGRLGVQVAQDADRSFSANFELLGQADTGQLVLTTPIGTRIAQARWEPGEVRLDTGTDTRHFADLDALADAVFQQPIPLVALLDWLAGRPWPGAPSTPLPAPDVGFSQLQWQIKLDRYPDGFVTAVKPGLPSVTVRARLDRP